MVRKRVLNVRLLLILAAGCAALGALGYVVHGLQNYRSAELRLSAAHKAQEEKDQDREIRYLRQYLALRPDDNERWARLVVLLDERARTPAAWNGVILTCSQVLRRELADPKTRTDIRRRLAKAYANVGRWADALQELNELLNPDKLSASQSLEQAKFLGGLYRLKGRCHEELREWQQAAAAYEAAIQQNPQDWEAYAGDDQDPYKGLAYVYREHGDALTKLAAQTTEERETKANGLVDKMVEAQPESPAVYLARHRYHRRYRSKEQAQQDLDLALKVGPDDPDVLRTAVEWILAEPILSTEKAEQAQNYVAHARKVLEAEDVQASQAKPAQSQDSARAGDHAGDLAAVYLLELQLALRRGDRKGAIDLGEKGIKRFSNEPLFVWALTEALIEAGDQKQAEENLKLLSRLVGSQGPVVLYLTGRMQLLRGEIAAAAASFEQVRAEGDQDRVASRAQYFLGWCYGRLEQPDLATLPLERAARMDPEWHLPVLDLARLYAAQGRWDEAVRAYEQAMTLVGSPPATPIELGRARFQRYAAEQVALPSEKRSWIRFEELSAIPNAIQESPVELLLLKADYLWFSGRSKEAVEELEQGVKQFADEPRLYWRLAVLHLERKDIEKAHDLLQTGENRLGDLPEFRIGRTKCLLAEQKVREAREVLARNLDDRPPEHRRQLLGALAQFDLSLGDIKGAKKAYAALTKEDPHALSPWLRLLDLATRAGGAATDEEREELKRLEEGIRDREGPQGTFWRVCQAWRLLRQGSRKGAKLDALVIRRLLDEARSRRPSWTPPLRLLAQLEQRQGNLDAAVSFLRDAISLGDQNPETTRQLVTLLYRRGRYAEADDAMQRLETRLEAAGFELEGNLLQLAADVSARTNDLDRALQKVRAVASGSKDAGDHLWRGQRLAALARRRDGAEKTELVEEARQALEEAVKLQPDSPQAWAALVGLYAEHQPEQALATIEQAEKQLSGRDGLLVLAACYHRLVNKPEEAERYYRRAIEAYPQDADVQQTAAMFFFERRKFAEAESCLEVARTLRPTSPELRRLLATVHVAQGTYRQWQKAMDRVEENLKLDTPRPEDLRLKAALLSIKGDRESRQQAIRILEDLIKVPSPQPADRHLLGQLYYREERPREGSQQMTLAIAADDTNPAYLASFVQILIDRKNVAAAALRLGQLEQLEEKLRQAPKDGRKLESPRSPFLKARWLHLAGRTPGAVELLRQLTAGKSDQATLVEAASLLEEFKATEDTDTVLQRLVETSPAVGTTFRALWLARQGRTREALDLLEPRHADPARRPQSLGDAVAVLWEDPAADQVERVERRLLEALSAHPDSTKLQVHLANLRQLQGRYAEAAEIFQKLAAKGERSLVVLNNLAWMLGEGLRRPREGMPYVEEAIRQYGPLPDLLDTRAVLLTRLGDNDRAVLDLQDAAQRAPKAVFYYHLARAYHQAGNGEAALKAMDKAEEVGGVDRIPLLEREEYGRLKPTLEALRRPAQADAR